MSVSLHSLPHETPPSRSLWNEPDLANPHALNDKAQRVQAMFNAIAPSYDLNNRVHSMWRDQAWRRAAVRAAKVQPGQVVLDVACGTGDLTMAFGKSPAARVIGLDFTVNMLTIAEQKNPSHSQNISSKPLSYGAADAMRLPVADASVDVVSIAFGIRNVSDPSKAIAEFFRVLKPGGRLIILEFGQPRSFIFRSLYQFYFHKIMPWTATWISGDRTGAYRYLPRSVNTFIERAAMLELMTKAGFTDLTSRSLTLGIALLYHGIKRDTK